MIICFNEKINTFLNNLINFNYTEQNIQDLMPTLSDIDCNCPKCNAKNNFSFHGAYSRNIVFVRNNNTYAFNVSVNRVICNSCGSTHALLPSFIVPYKTFSRYSILHIVAEISSSSIAKVAEKFQLSFQLVLSFFAIFMSFFHFVDSLNRQENLYQNFDETFFKLHSLLFCDDKFALLFFKRYKWIFLMTKFRNIKSPPIFIGVSYTLPHKI